MASFHAKIGWKRHRKVENKNCSSVLFPPDAKQKIPKKQKKNSKNSKIQLWLRFKTKQGGKDRERKKIKINVLFRSCSPRNRKFQKHCKKFKKLKNTIMASFQAKIDWGRQRK